MTDAERTDEDGAPSLSPEELDRRLRGDERVTLLDVRNRDEFEAWRIGGDGVTAVQVPHVKFLQSQVRGDPATLVDDLDDPIYVVCGRGEASAQVAAMLRDAGVDAANLAGGMEGWARVYDAVDVAHDDATVLQYRRPSSGCLAYLVVNDGEAAVIDPLRTFAERYVADAEERGAELRYAVDTHVHADHVSGVREVAGLSDAEVVVPTGARARGLDYDRDVRFVADGDAVLVGDATLTALHAPGHTSEMTVYRLGDLAFAGDLLFLESVARPDLEFGDEGAEDAARRLHRTLRERVLVLPDETRIAPGHYGNAAESNQSGAYVATLAELRERLRLLSLDEEAFVERVVGEAPPRPANDERIVETNLGRRPVDDEEAFELELGPNNCAATSAFD